jgi:hypothetical protein
MHICVQTCNCSRICDGNYKYLRYDMRARILNLTCDSMQACTLCKITSLSARLHERTFDARIPLRTLAFILHARYYKKELKVSPLLAM